MDEQKGEQPQSGDATPQFKPGETISPRQQNTAVATAIPAQPIAKAAAEPAAAVPESPPQHPATPPEPAQQAAQQTTQPEPQPLAEPIAASQLEAVEQPQPVAGLEAAEQTDSGQSITWSASEFIAHDKTAGWHVLLIVVAVVIAVIAWFIIRDIVTALVIVIAGVVLSLYGGRRPQQLQYQLDDGGLSIGGRHFIFTDFRAFSVIPEGAFASIALVPTKRFAPMTTLYFDPKDEDQILDILGSHLPHQERRADAVDALMRRIRF